jgi:hypothetical protein
MAIQKGAEKNKKGKINEADYNNKKKTAENRIMFLLYMFFILFYP